MPDLRDRIATAIWNAVPNDQFRIGDAKAAADAVIRELGLTLEENNMPTGHEWYRSRYVTDWKADDA